MKTDSPTSNIQRAFLTNQKIETCPWCGELMVHPFVAMPRHGGTNYRICPPCGWKDGLVDFYIAQHQEEAVRRGSNDVFEDLWSDAMYAIEDSVEYEAQIARHQAQVKELLGDRLQAIQEEAARLPEPEIKRKVWSWQL